MKSVTWEPLLGAESGYCLKVSISHCLGYNVNFRIGGARIVVRVRIYSEVFL